MSRLGKKDEKELRAERVLQILDPLYPQAKTALRYNSPFELLVATILSAQCTDERVNQVTSVLFKEYNTPEAFVGLPLEELEGLIRPTGFFKNKARAIKGAAKEIVTRFNGRVPNSMEGLITLPGVGRKTANVVLGAVFGVPGIVVDTHVKRLAKRLALTDSKDPDRIEMELGLLLPQEKWRRFSDVLIYHGRTVCKARNPLHAKCPLIEICPQVR